MIKIGNMYLVSEKEMDEVSRDMDRLYTYKLLAESSKERQDETDSKMDS